MNLKEQAAAEALKYVKSGMILGVGTGSTTRFFTQMLGKALQQGELKDIVAVPTSEDTAALVRELGIPLTTLDEHDALDLVVDGADEVDPRLNLIKGLGRALLREKIVEVHAKQFVVIVDESKLVDRLGQHVALPVEIVKFAAGANVRWLNSLGCEAKLLLEEDGKPAVSDNGNYFAHCTFKDGIEDANILASELAQWPGIVEHGLFLDMANVVIVGTEKGPKVMMKK